MEEVPSNSNMPLKIAAVAIFAIAIYTYLAISNWQDGIVGSRLNLTLGGTPIRLEPLEVMQHAARHATISCPDLCGDLVSPHRKLMCFVVFQAYSTLA